MTALSITNTISDTGRLVWAEHFKARKTRIYVTAVLLPMLICGLIFLVLMAIPDKDVSTIADKYGSIWMFARGIANSLYAGFMLPIHIALLASQLNGLEHNRNTWKVLLALPVTRASVYWAKALFLIVLVTVSQIALLLGLWGVCHIVGLIRPTMLTNATPWGSMVQASLAVWLSGLTVVAIHHLLALRVKGVGVNIGVALGGLVTAQLLMQGWKYVQYFSYAQPVLTGIASIAPEATFWVPPMWVGALSGVVLLALGAWLMPKRMPS